MSHTEAPAWWNYCRSNILRSVYVSQWVECGKGVEQCQRVEQVVTKNTFSSNHVILVQWPHSYFEFLNPKLKKVLTSAELLIDLYIPVRKKKSLTPVGIWTQVLLNPLFNNESTPQSITAWPIKIYRTLTPPKSLTDLLNIWAWAWHTDNLIGKKLFWVKSGRKGFFERKSNIFMKCENFPKFDFLEKSFRKQTSQRIAWCSKYNL